MTDVTPGSIAKLERCIDELVRILRGNDGNIGLVATVVMLAEEVKAIKDIETVLYGHKDDPTKRGVVADVEDLKKWKSELRYWYVLFVGAIVVGVANFFLELFK